MLHSVECLSRHVGRGFSPDTRIQMIETIAWQPFWPSHCTNLGPLVWGLKPIGVNLSLFPHVDMDLDLDLDLDLDSN
jgi:hypothetical protein